MLTNSYCDEILTKVHEAKEKKASYSNQDILDYYFYTRNKIVKRFKFTKHWFNLTFLFSLSLAASLGWLKRNMLVLPSNITAPDGKTTHH